MRAFNSCVLAAWQLVGVTRVRKAVTNYTLELQPLEPAFVRTLVNAMKAGQPPAPRVAPPPPPATAPQGRLPWVRQAAADDARCSPEGASFAGAVEVLTAAMEAALLGPDPARAAGREGGGCAAAQLEGAASAACEALSRVAGLSRRPPPEEAAAQAAPLLTQLST